MTSAAKPTLVDAMEELHRASCIINFVSENALEKDEVGLGETLKAAEHLVLNAIQKLQENGA